MSFPLHFNVCAPRVTLMAQRFKTGLAAKVLPVNYLLAERSHLS